LPLVALKDWRTRQRAACQQCAEIGGERKQLDRATTTPRTKRRGFLLRRARHIVR
jgi:hypothetical protein